MGVPVGEEEVQKIKNLFEKIIKENFLNMANKIDIQVQEAQRVPNKLDPKRVTPRHVIIKMPKVKDKERILKAAREKQRVTCKGFSIRQAANFPNFAGKKVLAKSIQSVGKQRPAT